MRIHQIFIMLLLVFSAVNAEEPGKDKKIPFDFPELKQDDIAARYHRYGYRDRKSSDFRFEMVFPKDWKIINLKEPAEIPDNGQQVEIGVFHKYKVQDDQNSEILAAIYVTALRIPSDWSDAKAVEKSMESLLKGHKSKVLKFQEYKTSNTTLKDILFTYDIPKDKTYWARLTGFKVKDDKRKYLIGKKDILYLIQLHTTEKDYRAYAAEAFYVAKISLKFL